MLHRPCSWALRASFFDDLWSLMVVTKGQMPKRPLIWVPSDRQWGLFTIARNIIVGISLLLLPIGAPSFASFCSSHPPPTINLNVKPFFVDVHPIDARVQNEAPAHWFEFIDNKLQPLQLRLRCQAGLDPKCTLGRPPLSQKVAKSWMWELVNATTRQTNVRWNCGILSTASTNSSESFLFLTRYSLWWRLRLMPSPLSVFSWSVGAMRQMGLWLVPNLLVVSPIDP